jgi:hypothetical protein
VGLGFELGLMLAKQSLYTSGDVFEPYLQSCIILYNLLVD